ncbi:metal-dependent transcriptional regulator [Pedobacter sp. MC2016-14]|uniref:metal-dependent transcriptional regulator n=1 Tax=Pedobacter sp. MC2016-14 TaxID=2897327 RepID=UPI001E5F87DE|nr:metal-dependent transcriptional regulator [Pedobacter sp. MC2016-14]MCD0489594.1 metal-dependent transcriptional regulator [Pedobacter sp. MC2016-14]
MKSNSFTEENYLKAIYHLSVDSAVAVQTNAIADGMHTKPASVTDMIKRLAEKQMVNYTRYQGVTLTDLGKKAAINVIRKHRLWEVFLVNKLNFKWDEVHDIAEQLEHVNSDILIDRLDQHLNFPRQDPHGDPIPDKNGKFEDISLIKLNKLQPGDKGMIVGVMEHSSPFLKHLEKIGLTLGTDITINDLTDFDGSVELLVSDKKLNISREVAKNILIKL